MKTEDANNPLAPTVHRNGRWFRGLIQNTFPNLASAYRQFRDYRQHQRRKSVTSSEGFRFYGDLEIEESRDESGELATFKQLLSSVETVFDIGANAGFFSLIAAQTGKDVIAVEPDFLNYQLLLQNLSENNIQTVEPIFGALSAKPGIERLFGGGQGASLKKNWVGITSTYSRLVPCNTLDQLVRTYAPTGRILVKLDVEGAEYEVLKGATETLQRPEGADWIVEHMFDEGFDDRINPNFRALFHLFWEFGYKARTIHSDPRIVTSQDVDLWIRKKERGFGWMYYYFSKDSA